MEIERKFIVNHFPDQLTIKKEEKIRQGYLAFGKNGTEVRIREIDDRFFLTVKGPGDIFREEIEIEINSSHFQSLWLLSDSQQITKTRYTAQFEEDQIEIDVYHGSLEGLIIAEIEFQNMEQCSAFVPPNWFAEEVTYNSLYKNKNLAIYRKIPPPC